MRAVLPIVIAVCGCAAQPPSFPQADQWSASGPGVGPVSFAESDLWQHCAYLTGGPEDIDHHNLVVMRDGYVYLPWAPEDGGGGITTFDLSDPCQPVKVGEAYHPEMRETHTMAFGTVGDRTYLATDHHVAEGPDGAPTGGIAFWDVTDPANPFWVSAIEVPNYYYPDAYFRVTLSATWIGDTVYAPGGLNGIFVIDASDPESPTLREPITFDPALLSGSFLVVGTVGIAMNAGMSRTVVLDLSDPLAPTPLADFDVVDGEGAQRPYYFGNLGGEYALFATKGTAGGPIVYDLSDPSNPTYVGDAVSSSHEEWTLDGGYVFRHEEYLFQGESNVALTYRGLEQPEVIGAVDLQGDVDTFTPLGHVAVISVDAGAEAGESSAVVPWQTAPDARGPLPKLFFPTHQQLFVSTEASVGISFDEMIEPASVFEGSFRIWSHRGQPVPGQFNVQENVVNFTPDDSLEPDTTYTVALPAGGIADISGNRLFEELLFQFSTGSKLK